MLSKHFIKNHEGQKLAVVVSEHPDHKGLVFVMHGLGGFKEQFHIQTMAEAFSENGYTTVLFDTRYSIGESDGGTSEATYGSYSEDLETVIAWAKNHNWYQEPFCMAGHSLGSFALTLYAEQHPSEVKGIAPTSTVISGQLSVESPFFQRILPEWKTKGTRHRISSSKSGAEIVTPYYFVEDSLNYDLLPKADQLTMSVFMAVGEGDDGTPLEHQQMLYDLIPGPKELHVIKDTVHTFKTSEALAELKQLLDKWIKTL